MDYKKIHDSIIENAKKRNIEHNYTEIHHVVPRCMGGNDDKDNLVILLYREHFLIHWLLCKIYPNNYKLKAAFAKMCEAKGKRIVCSYMFSAVKRNLKDAKYPWLKDSWENPWNKGKKGCQIPWNKGKKTGPVTELQKQKIAKTLKERYKHQKHPRKGISPWCAGTKGQGIVKAWNKGLDAKKLQCPHCSKIIGGEGNFVRWHGDNCKRKVS